jgi:hypothetical protein
LPDSENEIEDKKIVLFFINAETGAIFYDFEDYSGFGLMLAHLSEKKEKNLKKQQKNEKKTIKFYLWVCPA